MQNDVILSECGRAIEVPNSKRTNVDIHDEYNGVRSVSFCFKLRTESETHVGLLFLLDIIKLFSYFHHTVVKHVQSGVVLGCRHRQRKHARYVETVTARVIFARLALAVALD